MFHGRHFVRHLEIYNPICVKLLQVMSGVIPRNLKKNDVSISNHFPEVHKTRHTHTHTCKNTDTHTLYDSIRRSAMRCISPKNHKKILASINLARYCIGRFYKIRLYNMLVLLTLPVVT